MKAAFWKSLIPSRDAILNSPLLKVFGRTLQDARLWRFSRNGVANAVAIGAFMAWMPIPVQMWVSAALAIVIRANIPIAMGTVWLTNPITIIPMFYGVHWIGERVLGPSQVELSIDQLTLDNLSIFIEALWQPLLVGCLIAAPISSVIGWFLVHACWRIHIINRAKRWQAHRQAKKRA